MSLIRASRDQYHQFCPDLGKLWRDGMVYTICRGLRFPGWLVRFGWVWCCLNALDLLTARTVQSEPAIRLACTARLVAQLSTPVSFHVSLEPYPYRDGSTSRPLSAYREASIETFESSRVSTPLQPTTVYPNSSASKGPVLTSGKLPESRGLQESCLPKPLCRDSMPQPSPTARSRPLPPSGHARHGPPSVSR